MTRHYYAKAEMDITKIISKTFDSRLKQISLYASQASEIQYHILSRLINQAAQTEWGKKYDYASIRSYEDFRNHFPIQTYEEMKLYVERLQAGGQNLLWPSGVRWFAGSPGATNDKSKFLPISKEALEDVHYRGGEDATALYFRVNPDSHFFSGKRLILRDSHSPNLNSNHSLAGDLSTTLIQNVNPSINFIRVSNKKVALVSEWETKIEAIADNTIPVNVTSLSGVPSWMLVLIRRILEGTGKQALEEMWPDLEIFFYGGAAFIPYREQYEQVIHSKMMHYIETHSTSERYFGTRNDPSNPTTLLMIDYDIFYKLVPLGKADKENPRAYYLEEVELSKSYAMVVSTSCGLWRYMIGDTVKFTDKNPYKFIITGRTKHFISASEEELTVDNAEKGLAKACAKTEARVYEYFAALAFIDEHAKCRHQWLIEFARMLDSVEKFATVLDATLKEVNSDYEMKR